MELVEVEAVVDLLTTILYDAALPSALEPYAQWPGASWGRRQVVHYALGFLVSLSYTSSLVHAALCAKPNFAQWLRRLIIEAPEVTAEIIDTV